MNKIDIQGTPKTPTVEFDVESGVLTLKGRSIPENSIEFYYPLIEWIDEYALQPADKTIVNIQLEYFNTSSSKCLVEIFRRLEKLQKDGKPAAIRWYYEEEDEDMQESGEDFKEIIKLPIKMILVEDKGETDN